MNTVHIEKTLASRLREALDLRGKKQVDICTQTGIPKSALSQYLSGAFEPKQNRLWALANALNVSEAWLMGYDVPMERQAFSDLQSTDESDIDIMIDSILANLIDSNSDTLMLDGKPASPRAVEYLRESIRANIEHARKLNAEDEKR